MGSTPAGGKPPAVIHVDLDGAPHIFRVHGWDYPSDEDPLFLTGFRAFLDMFAKRRLRATLFVIAEDVNNPAKHELLAEAVRQGHEIASHTVTHEHLTRLDEPRRRDEIVRSRELIGERLDTRVAGFRAPGFHIDRRALELLDDAGYSWDSSLFPHRGHGASTGESSSAGQRASTGRSSSASRISASSAQPHRLFPDRPLVELPMPAHRPLPFPFHPSYSLIVGTPYFRLGLRKHRRTRAPYVMLFHLTDLADPLPAEMLSGQAQRYYTLSNMDAHKKRARCEGFLDLVEQHYCFDDNQALLARALHDGRF